MSAHIMARVESVAWDSYAQPEWNRAESIEAAFRSLVECRNEASTQASYHKILSTLGNDHGGTYFPVALPAIPILGDFIRDVSRFARYVALGIIDDYLLSFHPDPQFNTVINKEGVWQSLEVLMKAEIHELRPIIENRLVISQRDRDDQESQLAMEVLAEMR